MKPTTDIDAAAEGPPALSDSRPESNNGVVPVVEDYDVPLTRRAVDSDALAEVPGALAAYLDFQQDQWG